MWSKVQGVCGGRAHCRHVGMGDWGLNALRFGGHEPNWKARESLLRRCRRDVHMTGILWVAGIKGCLIRYLNYLVSSEKCSLKGIPR